MKEVLSKNLIEFAKLLNKPLYVVGGAVRDYLIGKCVSDDVDLSAGIPVEEMVGALNRSGYKILAEYKRMGTVVFSDNEKKYEYTAFRREKYVGGEHKPRLTEFTEDILEDARRRDFKCNAVYYDITRGEYVDPLNGINDIKNKVLDSVVSPNKVFSSDGLRLMRLARFAGELNFKPTEQVLQSVKRYADNILDVSPERIFAELLMILQSDSKHPFSDKKGHYNGLKILEQTKVLDKILPELTEGRAMAQRADFHKYDVLEHSLRCVLYADKSVRLDALLHDIGKPFCFNRYKNYYSHFIEGAHIAKKILTRLKADKQTIKRVEFIVRAHMVDIDCAMKEDKVRKFIVDNFNGYYEQLLMVKQADFRAGLDSEQTAPTLIKWAKILQEMKEDNTPFSLKDLKISAYDLISIGYTGERIGKELIKLHTYCVNNPQSNQHQTLMKIAKRDLTANK